MTIASIDSGEFDQAHLEESLFDDEVIDIHDPDVEQALQVMVGAVAEARRVTLLKQLHLEQYGKMMIDAALLDHQTHQGLTEHYRSTLASLSPSSVQMS